MTTLSQNQNNNYIRFIIGLIILVAVLMICTRCVTENKVKHYLVDHPELCPERPAPILPPNDTVIINTIDTVYSDIDLTPFLSIIQYNDSLTCDEKIKAIITRINAEKPKTIYRTQTKTITKYFPCYIPTNPLQPTGKEFVPCSHKPFWVAIIILSLVLIISLWFGFRRAKL